MIISCTYRFKAAHAAYFEVRYLTRGADYVISVWYGRYITREQDDAITKDLPTQENALSLLLKSSIYQIYN